MCGVLGLIYPGRDDDQRAITSERLRTAAASLRHRGPDDLGTWIQAGGQVGFAHTRLAILDLSALGHQPMLTLSGDALTYNGEIYNFKELHGTALNHRRLQGTSDSEVLLHGLAAQGSDFIRQLSGMFAFGFYEAHARRVILAVDPAGEKPLYTYWDGKCFAFASEIKALKALLQDEADLSLDSQALRASLAFGYVPYPRTVYNKIRKLAAGHFQYVDLQSGPLKPQMYWDVPLGQVNEKIKFHDAVGELRTRLQGAVAQRLVADVPLGCFLSGGLDSSAISYEAAKVLQPRKLKTFSASYAQGPFREFYDESVFARRVAERIGSEHIEVEIPTEGYDAEGIMNRFDEPFGDSSAIPTYLLCAATRRYLKVVLTGDAGDELFGGYLRFRASLVAENYKTLWRLFLAPLLPFRSKPFSLMAKLQRFRSAVGLPPLARLATWNAFFSESELNAFLGEKLDHLSSELRAWDEKTKGLSLGEKLLYYNFKTYLFDDLLPKIDRMSMAHGLELRSPFLDKALIEFAFHLPTSFKFDAFTTKKILKVAYDEPLGRDITRRAKHGFAFPIEGLWANGKGRDLPYVQNLLPHSDMKRMGPLNKTAKKFMLWSLESQLQEGMYGSDSL